MERREFLKAALGLTGGLFVAKHEVQIQDNTRHTRSLETIAEAETERSSNELGQNATRVVFLAEWLNQTRKELHLEPFDLTQLNSPTQENKPSK